MSKIWFFLMSTSVFVLTIFFPDKALVSMMNTGNRVVTLCIEFCALYSVWMGIIEILEKSGLNERIAKAFTPMIKKLFKTNNPEAIKYISLSISANLLGLGNIATPTAIEAMRELDNKEKRMPFSMLMFTIFSTASLQLLPNTVISLRIQSGSQTPNDIVFPTLIVSIIALLFSISQVLIFEKIRNLLKKPQKTRKNKAKTRKNLPFLTK